MGGLFGGKASNAVQQEVYAGVQVSTSEYGQPIPIVGGRQRVPFTLMWYGNFQATANNEGGGKGGSGGGSKTYTYSTAFQALLAMGPCQGVNQIWHDKALETLTSENLTLFLGATGQATWTGYPASTPAGQKLPYSNICHADSSLYNLGSSAGMPNITFELEGSVPSYSPAHGMYDCDLTAFIPYYLTDPVAGAGFQGTIQNLQGTTDTVQSYCMSLGLTASPYENTQRAATDCMKELLQIMNCECFLSVGQLKILPLGDQAVSNTTPDGTAWSWTPNLTPLFEFTDDHYCPQPGDPPVKLRQKRLNDTHNMGNVEYVDRSNQYNTATVNASIRSDIALTGPRLMSTITLHQITNAQTALTVGQLILQADRYEMNTYEFRTRQDFTQVEPLDYVALWDYGLGLAGQVCRVLSVDDDQDDYLVFSVLEIPGVVRTTAQYNWNAAAGYTANYAAAPGSVLTPAIFQMPPIAQSLSEGITIGIAVAPSASSTFWLGCNAWMSVDGGTTYFPIGTINTPARYGTITANLSAVADPDTTSTLAIALSDTALGLGAVTHADADSNQTLILVGTGSTAEIMSYGSATLTSAGHYNLSYLRRNLYGSTNQAHTSGAPFVRLDGNLFQIAIDPGYAGQTLWFKFTSFNTWSQAEEDISAVTAYSYTLPSANSIGGAVGLIPRGNCALTDGGTTVYKNANASFAWDSDAVSAKPYTQVSISGQVNLGGSAAEAIGLVTSTASTLNPTTNMNYCIYPNTGTGATQIVESGVVKLSLATPSPGDQYNIVYDGFTVKYFVNGVNFWSTPAQGKTLYAGIAQYSPAAAFTDVAADYGAAATPTQWFATGNCAVNDTNAMKQGGSSAWDSCVYSIIGYQTCHITAKLNTVNTTEVAIGLSSQPNVSSSYTNAGYALVNDTTGPWKIYQSGTLVAMLGTASASDLPAITYDGTTVTYWINGVSQGTTTAAGQTLYGFCSFFNPGAGINSLRFGPTTNLAVQDTSQIGLNAATNLSFTVDDNTYATTFSSATLAGNFPGTGMIAVPQVPNPTLSFTAVASQTVIITATGTIYFNNTSPVSTVSQAYVGVALIDTTAGGTSNVLVGYSPHAGVSRSFNNISAGASVTTSPSPTQQFAFQFEEPVTQGHTYVVAVFCQVPGSAVTAETTSVQIQVETIKR